MPAESINVVPPELLAAAAAAAATAQRAATPQPGSVPVTVPGSPTDAALAMIAGGIADDVVRMCAEVAGKGPAVQGTTSAGVASLTAEDAENAAQIASVPTDLGF